ncbi:MAG: M14 family metallopeptidase [Chloroflexota bacterium]
MKTNTADLFPKNYTDSRERFLSQHPGVLEYWSDATLGHHALADHANLTIDWLRADALDQPERILIITTGEHGAEGKVGAAMLQLFMEQYLPRLNPQNTGLLLVHALNPWGMQNNRRVNANNVDLNRNFIGRGDQFKPEPNADYRSLNTFLNPQQTLPGYPGAGWSFMLKLLKIMFSPGESALRAGTLIGQHEYPQGLYFGGWKQEEETRVMMSLYKEAVLRYKQILHLDMHTGYGPRFQMSLVNSPLEPRTPQELSAAFDYPAVVAATSDEFYDIQGDMIDWIYRFVQRNFPEKRLYATAFEFGTLGDSLPNAVRSLKAMIFENQVYWHGAASEGAEQRIKATFRELYSPTEQAWRENAVVDARRAFDGILRDQGFF